MKVILHMKHLAIICVVLLSTSAFGETWNDAKKKAIAHCEELFPGGYQMQAECMKQQLAGFQKMQMYKSAKKPSDIKEERDLQAESTKLMIDSINEQKKRQKDGAGE
jgi:hypothetical protein